MTSLILKSTIQWPNCGHQKTETMPTDSRQYFRNWDRSIFTQEQFPLRAKIHS